MSLLRTITQALFDDGRFATQEDVSDHAYSKSETRGQIDERAGTAISEHSARTDDPHQARAQAISTIRDSVPASYNTLRTLYELLISHTSRANNPHAVTAAQVGLGNVANKSEAQMAADGPIRNTIESRAGDYANDRRDALRSELLPQINAKQTALGFTPVISDNPGRIALHWSDHDPYFRIDSTYIQLERAGAADGRLGGLIAEKFNNTRLTGGGLVNQLFDIPSGAVITDVRAGTSNPVQSYVKQYKFLQSFSPSRGWVGAYNEG